MKNLLISLPMFLVLSACATKDEDTGADADDEFAVGNGSSSGGSSTGGSDGGDTDGGGDGGGSGGGSTGGSTGGGGMGSAPGCEAAGAFCMAYTGAAWSGQEEMQCDSYSSQSQGAGGPAFTYASGGCSAGAVSMCDGFLAGVDQDGNLVAGSDMELYFYSGITDSQAQDLCNQYAGNYSTL